MRRKYTTTILATALLFSLGGCVKDELHDTPHPDKGIVAVSIDLPQGASGEDYTVEIDGTPFPTRCLPVSTPCWHTTHRKGSP